MHIEYLDEGTSIDYQIPQLCEFIDRSENLNLSRFRSADLTVEAVTATIELLDGGRSSFRLSIMDDGIGQVVNQLSALLTDVNRLSINSLEVLQGDREMLGLFIEWPELLRPFTAVKALSVDDKLSSYIPPALNDATSEGAAEVLPVLNLLRIKSGLELMNFMKTFVATRRNVGRPVTIVGSDTEFQKRLHIE